MKKNQSYEETQTFVHFMLKPQDRKGLCMFEEVKITQCK